MDVTPLIKSDRMVIQSYKTGQFKISGQIHDGNILVFLDQVVPWNLQHDPNHLTCDDFQQLIDFQHNYDAQIDIIILGCGEKTIFIPPFLRQDLKKHGLSIEAMDTGAAARTYNVLMAEDRRVVAALMPYQS